MPLNSAASSVTPDQLAEIEELYGDASWETVEDFMTWVSDVVLDGSFEGAQIDAPFKVLEDLSILSELQADRVIASMHERASDDDEEMYLDDEDEDDDYDDEDDEEGDDDEEDEDT